MNKKLKNLIKLACPVLLVSMGLTYNTLNKVQNMTSKDNQNTRIDVSLLRNPINNVEIKTNMKPLRDTTIKSTDSTNDVNTDTLYKDEQPNAESTEVTQTNIEESQQEEIIYEEPIVYEEPTTYEEPAPITYNPYTISINGISGYYTDLGTCTATDEIQGYLDSGHIVGSLTSFSPNDNETTYFTGHNPGAFTYMANNIGYGSTIVVTDSSGNEFNYTPIDSVYVDTSGTAIISSIGLSAIELYKFGSHTESIAIQYCVAGTMIVWYCIPV